MQNLLGRQCRSVMDAGLAIASVRPSTPTLVVFDVRFPNKVLRVNAAVVPFVAGVASL